MDRSKDLGQQKVVDLDRGLFCIQYQSADDEASPPKVVVSAAPGHEREVELVLHPDADEAVLWQPGSSLIVRTNAAVQLHVQVVPLRQNGSKAAAVKFEPLTQGTPVYRAGGEWDSAADDGMRLLGHVAGIGDVLVGPNEWIAGPTAPSRIEGIAIQWPQKPGDVDLRYAVKSASQPGTPKMVDLQSFAGTRQRALPITGIVLELSGPSASNYQLWAEALFLSSPTLRAIGQRLVLSGPTGREPLVGLRIAIQRTAISDEPNLPAQPTAVVNKTPSSKGKVRVFRSRPKQAAALE
ncbi:MAG: hypothetical protein ABI407_00670 [Bradyrhizobium sp.]